MRPPATALCVSPYCGLPGRHVDDCDGEDAHGGECRGCLPALADHGLYLCRLCVRRIRHDAYRAAWLDAALGNVLAGGGGHEHVVASTREPGLDLNTAVMEARDAIRATLTSLVRLVATERGITLPTVAAEHLEELPDGVHGPRRLFVRRYADARPATLARYLIGHADWLAAHHQAAHHARDLRDIACDRRTFRLAFPATSDRLFIGTCPLTAPATDGSRRTCGTRLYQLPDEPLVTCGGCATVETLEWWQRAITGSTGGVVDAYAGASRLAARWTRPVEPVLIRQWASRGRVLPLTEPVPGGGDDARRPVRDARGRVQYQLADLEAHARTLWGPPTDEARRRRRGRDTPTTSGAA